MCILSSFVLSFSHFAVTHKPWVWKLVGSVHDIFQGASILAWIYQHTLGHHPYTNIDGADPDIVTASAVSSCMCVCTQGVSHWIKHILLHVVAPSLVVSIVDLSLSPVLWHQCL